MLILRSLLVALMVALVGCATADRPPDVVVSEYTWRQVDSDIGAASDAAAAQAEKYALDFMESWMDLVYKRTDDDFIPWFSSYWTRQWLSMKVAWYRVSADGDKDSAVNRLSIYLQEQYQDRVLEPVSEQIDPDDVMQKTTSFYVLRLGEQLQVIPQRYGVPPEQFDQRLNQIPAIALTQPAYSASLYQVVHADPLDELQAYDALIERILTTPGGPGAWASNEGIASMAKHTSETLEAELTASSAASALGALVGRVAGSVISLGVAGFTALTRENERPATEARLRKNINAAFDEEWLNLMRNRETGVLAGVYYLSGQIEVGLGQLEAQRLKYEPVAGDASSTPIPAD
ncbi:hypothetical protein NVV93_09790 [Pseudomonas sp. LS44]|uniref:hypothetical protein n=1 Tax=Pseudomonas sp. LS44 TaxID=1357074 RepID=UPI00215B027F|nr:hypothetical protein [Pseudomonas sp. LS44]UVE19634.1 hypothetical protein NVV93_09790 [Pseudomonas sp. LS44]